MKCIKNDKRPAVDWLFRSEVAAQKKLRGLTDADLSDLTKIPLSTIRAYMSGKRDSDTVAAELARVLELER